VASLWSVDDDATAQLIVGFYQGLKAGKPKDEALRDAMLAVKGRKADPFFWAAFQVNGDTAALKL
jgi:CHAT domain-containing protein